MNGIGIIIEIRRGEIVGIKNGWNIELKENKDRRE